MVKTTMMTILIDNLENIEMERSQAYFEKNGFESECVHLYGNDADELCSCIDLNSIIFCFFVYSESSVYPAGILTFAELANKIKCIKNDSIIVFCGKYTSLYYKDILDDNRFANVDYVILGDCEYSLKKLVNCVEKKENVNEFVKQQKNIASRSSMENKEFLNIDINELPIPVRTYDDTKSHKNYYAFIGDSNGCNSHCAFCTRGQFYNKWTGRSAESIFEEVKKINIESSVKCFWFAGGSFNDPGGEKGVAKIKNFCNLILQDDLKVSMRCYLRSNFVYNIDIELFKLMKKAGFHVALVGVESGNQFDLDLYNKGTTVEYNRVTLKKLKEAGIYVDHFGFIMVNPYSTPSRFRENFLFLEEHQPHDLDNYVHHVVADPGTLIRKKIEEDGLFIPTNDFLRQGHSYKFVHPYAAEVSAFLHKYFLIFDTETAGTSTFIYHFVPFLPDKGTYIEEISSIMGKRARVYSEYFKMLYVNMDIGACERQYDEFISVFKSFEMQLGVLKNKLIRDLIKYKII